MTRSSSSIIPIGVTGLLKICQPVHHLIKPSLTACGLKAHLLVNSCRIRVLSQQAITECHERRATEGSGWENHAEERDCTVASDQGDGSVRGGSESISPQTGENPNTVACQTGGSGKPPHERLKRQDAVFSPFAGVDEFDKNGSEPGNVAREPL